MPIFQATLEQELSHGSDGREIHWCWDCAGIACIGMGGAGVGVGIIFGNYLAAAIRNPSAAAGQFANLIFGFAITEALGIFSLLIALLLLFALG